MKREKRLKRYAVAGISERRSAHSVGVIRFRNLRLILPIVKLIVLRQKNADNAVSIVSEDPVIWMFFSF